MLRQDNKMKFMHDRRGMELTFVIVGLVLALVVLVILMLIFSNTAKKSGAYGTECEKNGGACVELARCGSCKSISDCRSALYSCQSKSDSEAKSLICCPKGDVI